MSGVTGATSLSPGFPLEMGRVTPVHVRKGPGLWKTPGSVVFLPSFFALQDSLLSHIQLLSLSTLLASYYLQGQLAWRWALSHQTKLFSTQRTKWPMEIPSKSSGTEWVGGARSPTPQRKSLGKPLTSPAAQRQITRQGDQCCFFFHKQNS